MPAKHIAGMARSYMYPQADRRTCLQFAARQRGVWTTGDLLHPVVVLRWSIGAHEHVDRGLDMLFGGFALWRAGAADQQAEVGAALDQAEELIGGAGRIGDAQLARLIGLAQQARHLVEQALRAGFVEHLRQPGILAGLGP